MKIREKRPGGDFVEHVFVGDSPHLASSIGGQSNGDDAGVYKSLQTNVSNCEQKIVQKKTYPITVFSRMEAFQTIQATSNGETDSSSLSSPSASA